MGLLEPAGRDRCTLTIGADSYNAVTAFIVNADVEFSLLDPAEAAAPIAEVAHRLLRGTGAAPPRR